MLVVTFPRTCKLVITESNSTLNNRAYLRLRRWNCNNWKNKANLNWQLLQI